uniref:Meiosis specific with OB-fold n=1 Tax=Nothoprocta perdicaria TaxID=30464 RepID=A0A8C6ZQC6_NOTPE
ETVIFASDVRINFDKFRNCMTATKSAWGLFWCFRSNPKSFLLTSNAFVVAAVCCCCLLLFAAVVAVVCCYFRHIDVYTVEELKAKALQNDGKLEPIYGIIYGFISTLDIDNDASKIIRKRCSGCRCVVNEAANACAFCGDLPADAKATFTSFDILVNVSDHSGTLPSWYLSDCAAEEALGCTVHDFLTLTEDKKTALKWHLLLERSKIYFKLTLSPSWRTGLKVNVLSCKLADPTEASQSLLRKGKRSHYVAP